MARTLLVAAAVAGSFAWMVVRRWLSAAEEEGWQVHGKTPPLHTFADIPRSCDRSSELHVAGSNGHGSPTGASCGGVTVDISATHPRRELPCGMLSQL